MVREETGAAVSVATLSNPNDSMIQKLPSSEKQMQITASTEQLQIDFIAHKQVTWPSLCITSVKQNPFLCSQIKQEKISIPPGQFTNIN